MTAHSTTRYEKALKRNLDELHQAILERRALIGLIHTDSESAPTFDFFSIAFIALYNDMVAHTIKVFEYSDDSASFWYIEKSNEAAINKAARSVGVKISDIRNLSAGFEHIRNKTHFHIDKDGVMNPKMVWKDAGVQGDDLGHLLESAASILIHLYEERMGKDYEVSDYDGTDVEGIIRSYFKDKPDGDVLT